MAVVFAVRGDTTLAYHAKALPDPTIIGSDITIAADAGAIGGSAIDCQGNTSSAIFWPGDGNFPTSGSFSVLLRVKKNYSGAPAVNTPLLTIGQGLFTNLGLYHSTADQLAGYTYSPNDFSSIFVGTNHLSSLSTYITSTAYSDLVVTYTGDTTALGFKIYIDGTVRYQAATNPNSWAGWTNKQVGPIGVGAMANTGLVKPSFKIDEFVIWDEIIDPTSVTLASDTVGSLNGSSRTEFVSYTAFDGSSSVDPGIANVLSGTAYTINGISLTGTYHDATYTDPGLANVLSGTSYIFNDSTLTGTLVTGGTYTDPGIANVRTGTSYVFNDSTLTGVLAVPATASGQAGTLDLNNIKEQLRYAINQENTTTSGFDLSANMSYRVQKVLKINPEQIPVQASWFPAVSVFIESKDIENATISKNQTDAKRKATLDIKIAGLVWNDILSSNIEDPADEDLENLMENIELILRSHPTIAGTVNWQRPSNQIFFSFPVSEQTHLRSGVLTLEAEVFY